MRSLVVAVVTAFLLGQDNTNGFAYSPTWTQASRKTHTTKVQLSMGSGQTYTAVTLPGGKRSAASKRVVLVRSGEREEVLKTIASWTDVDEGKMSEWMDMGIVFSQDAEGAKAIYESEAQLMSSHQSKRKFRDSAKFAASMFLETSVGDDKQQQQMFVKSSKPNVMSRVRDAGLRSFSPSHLEEDVRRGNVFTNVSKLFVDEQMVGRANSIATRLHDEFPISSPEWKRWTDRTTLYNATSLTQVMATYFRENSIGDVGGPKANYIPKRGYPGTLAPGEMFTDNYPIEDLPRKILHPWPAMQQIQFHVRYPPNHPLIPPPMLWLGLNDMYPSDFTEAIMNLTSSEDLSDIVGGIGMEPKDAIRIARFGKLGMSYQPEEQIEHGGMIFPGGHQIPFYNPDHGPTVNAAQAKPPVPLHLLTVTERWLDPLYGMDIPVVKSAIAEEEEEDDLLEQEIRKYTVERVLLQSPSEPDSLELSESEAYKRRVEDELAEVLMLRSHSLEQIDKTVQHAYFQEFGERFEKKPMDIETLADKMTEPSKARELARQITDSIFGRLVRASRILHHLDNCANSLSSPSNVPTMQTNEQARAS